jgi:hypothetical protein
MDHSDERKTVSRTFLEWSRGDSNPLPLRRAKATLSEAIAFIPWLDTSLPVVRFLV